MMRAIRERIVALALVALVASAGVLAASAQEASPSASPAASPSVTPAVVREVINEGMPEAAPGQVLQLVRYTIQPNTVLPVHIHPGMQVALIEAGTLHYTVIDGSAPVARADGTQETVTSGKQTDFAPGDRFIEAQGMVHFGENRGDEPVVILVASLFAAGQPPSTVVEATPAP